MRTDPDGIVREAAQSPYPTQCVDDYKSACNGEEFEEPSTTGATYSIRCRKHRSEYEDRMQKVHEDINSRYPGYNTPGSMPPADFDPYYCGERWEEDY